jgi:hypothetical protein
LVLGTVILQQIEASFLGVLVLIETRYNSIVLNGLGKNNLSFHGRNILNTTLDTD